MYHHLITDCSPQAYNWEITARISTMDSAHGRAHFGKVQPPMNFCFMHEQQLLSSLTLEAQNNQLKTI